MKILTDFDGVLTDPSEEGKIILKAYHDQLMDLGLSGKLIDQLFKKADQSFKAFPTQYGWMSQNRISAYWDEDPFIYLNAIGFYFDSIRDQTPELKEAPIDQFSDLIVECFKSIESIHPLDPEAIEILLELQEKGHQVTIVSNSNPERIQRILGENASKIDIRGSAKKFELGDAPKRFHAGTHPIDIDRPLYLNVLNEIQPDIVIGDVFSLDLALPLYSKKVSHVLIRKRSYTPSWSLKTIESEPTGKIINHFSEASEIL